MTRRFLLRALFSRRRRARPLAGILAVLGLLAVEPAVRADEAMSFQLAPIGNPHACGAACPKVIAAEGEIVDSTPETFLDFLGGHRDGGDVHAIVFLNSPGGKVVAAMELGKIFRRAGIAAVVARAEPHSENGLTQFTGGRCFSACVYALMGAKKRVVPRQSKVGLHRMFAYDSNVERADPAGDRRRRYDDGRMAGVLERYSGMMGISSAIVRDAEHGAPDALRILTPAEIVKWRLGSPKF